MKKDQLNNEVYSGMPNNYRKKGPMQSAFRALRKSFVPETMKQSQNIYGNVGSIKFN